MYSLLYLQGAISALPTLKMTSWAIKTICMTGLVTKLASCFLHILSVTGCGGLVSELLALTSWVDLTYFHAADLF